MKWLILLALAGCAADYQWHQVYPPSQEIRWIKVPYRQLHAYCGTTVAETPNLGACAIQLQQPGVCYIYSDKTREEAYRALSGDGIDLKTHEEMHCEGKRHIPK